VKHSGFGKATQSDEIETFHFTRSFCANIILPQNYKSQTVSREKQHKTLSYKKSVCKMLVKLRPGVNFTNILREAFMHRDPKSTKKKRLTA